MAGNEAELASEDAGGNVAGSNGPVVQGPADILYDNGPLVNSPGTGAGGADESILQTVTLSMGTLGWGHQIAFDNRIADEFTVSDPSGWRIDSITFYAYQTGSTTTSTINDMNLRIWDGVPGGGGAVVWGDTSTNVLDSTGWSGIYRGCALLSVSAPAKDCGVRNPAPI